MFPNLLYIPSSEERRICSTLKERTGNVICVDEKKPWTILQYNMYVHLLPSYECMNIYENKNRITNDETETE